MKLNGLTLDAAATERWYRSLKGEVLAEVDKLLHEDRQDVLWRPLIDETDPLRATPQKRAFDSAADELFYGGAAGGGKTDLICGLVLTNHRRSAIFRREVKQTAAIVDRLSQILGGRIGYNGQERIWKCVAGRTIEFGGCRSLGDEEAWQGRPHDLKAFDEVTQFLEIQFRYLIAWNRSTDPEQRCRVVATGNPPTTPEGEWVTSYWGPWLDPGHSAPAAAGELRYFLVLDGEDVEVEGPAQVKHRGELLTPRSRTFIPSRIDDNPFLVRTGYKATLQGLPEPIRSKFLSGDFQAGKDDHPWQVIPTAWIDAAMARWTADGDRGRTMDGLGVDVARGGADDTVISVRNGPWFGPLDVHAGGDTPDGDAAARLVLRRRRDAVPMLIDVTGVGASVYDILKRHGQAVAFQAAGASLARDRSRQMTFVNKRAESWWLMREDLDPASGLDLALPPDRRLRADLASARFELNASGIRIEPKQDIKARIGRSPDRGEAVLLARYTFRKVADNASSGGMHFADTGFKVL